MSAWKMLAAHHQEKRKIAEMQQRQLYTEIRIQTAMIREFRGFVRDQLANAQLTFRQHKKTRFEPSDTELYKAYVEALDGLYDQTDAVLIELNSMDGDSGAGNQVWTRNTESGHFQFTDKYVVPFDFEETCHSRWFVAHMLHRQEDRELYHNLKDTEHTMAFKFRFTTRLATGKIASILQRIAIRRYKEAGRMVIVWKAFMEGEGIFTGMHADETGWGVATPFTGELKAGTMLRTCVRIVPMHFSTVAMQESVAKEFTGIAPQFGIGGTRRLKMQKNEDSVAKQELERAKDRKRRRAYRERRRIERDGLQQEIEKLTEELKIAQGHGRVITSAWKMIADRQLAARMASEAEQNRLCDAIDSRAALLKQFHELMSEHIAEGDILPGGWDDTETASCQHKRVRLETDDAIFSTYIEELDKVYAQTDETFRSRGLDAEPNWDEPSDNWIKDPDTGFFLYGGKLTLPFDFREICRSRWYTAPLWHRQESRQLYQGVDDPDNTVAFKFRITTRLSSGAIASVLQRVTLRRYKEKERMVIVWRLFTEGEGIFNGMNADETGWNVATPAVNSTKTGTVMLTCVRNVPMHLNNVTTGAPAVKQFADKLVEWGSENHLEVTNTLKNLSLTDK
ncbi:Hypothetical protein PHPALM_15275 [Phytophthora palmivora]|uniref:M96 mating-specific protein family n=1 Tax=Phytophthora palmivora TaxID=4796 RepID=A0A2P4XSM9_9STRA|nr:Hypothetical protein PHPALM_15275 [Phytophthora palmivora]